MPTPAEQFVKQVIFFAVNFIDDDVVLRSDDQLLHCPKVISRDEKASNVILGVISKRDWYDDKLFAS